MFDAPRPLRNSDPCDRSLIISGVNRLIVVPVRVLSKIILSSPIFVDAVKIASLSEPLPELLVLVTKIGAIVGVVESVPPTERLVTTPKKLPPVIKVRFVGQVTGAETEIFPAVLLPIVSVLAVIRLSSIWDKPSVVIVSVPLPRSISVPFPIGWMATLPAVVAFTVPVRFTLLAVRVIKPALE